MYGNPTLGLGFKAVPSLFIFCPLYSINTVVKV